ncbi:MAG: MATE family efflux transporter [Clostridia bacterium]|nr:MATE family efflux transporter [Clostridia bacterium]
MDKTNASVERLGTEPIGKLLFKLAIPTVTAQIINMLYNIVDRIYIGHIPNIGTAALTGVGVCLPLIMIVSAFASLVSSGGAPRSSIRLGEGKPDEAERILGNSFTLQLIISAVLTVVILFFARPILLAFGASNDTIGYAVRYMNIYAIGTVFVQLTLGMNAFISAQGFTKVSMFTVLVGAVTNIALDPLFIYGFKLDVSGAAIATLISQAISSALALAFLLSNKSKIRLKPQYMPLKPRVILPCVALGLSMFIMTASESLISVCFNSSLQKYGGDMAVGAMTILTSVMQFAMLPLQGIGQGAQPIASYNYGAGNADRVKKTFRLLLIVNIIYSGVFWVLVMAFPRLFASIFTPDVALADYASKVMRIYFGAMFVFGIQIACQMLFISIGNALCSITVAVVRKFVLILPLIYILPCIFENKVNAVFTAEPVSDFLAVCFTSVLFILMFTRSMKKLEAKKQNR